MNKLKIGDKVKLKQSTIEWMLNHTDMLIDYKHGEISLTSIEELGSYALSLKTKKPIYGKVIDYGSYDDMDTKKQFVKVTFGIKPFSSTTHFSESHLTKVYKRRKS